MNIGVIILSMMVMLFFFFVILFWEFVNIICVVIFIVVEFVLKICYDVNVLNYVF